ncbi:putative UDP-N-acetylglucosamine 2-epimerase [Clostridia bacterium]|nr:putative UDP-N-acetylglucosamine 2-epimerase [Clostridia bacterium]
MKVLSVFGTRPEAVKMCPVVLELGKRPEIDSVVCLTGQHREQLDQVTQIFGVCADYDLNVMQPRQTPAMITAAVLTGFDKLLTTLAPDVVLVHGDTTTAMSAALAAFYRQIPVGHVEAGLRTFDLTSPFPEEFNRVVIDKVSAFHFAPTAQNRENLEREGFSDSIAVTGNTVIDAFAYTLGGSPPDREKLVLVTAHRRENLGRPLENICNAIKILAENHPDYSFVYPVHLNPAVRDTVFPILDGLPNVKLLPPVDVVEMHGLMSRAFLVLSDSGGLQEEAAHFDVPVLVLRTETERPEAAEAGTVKVVGVNQNDIVREAQRLFSDKAEYARMAKAVNPYGDGHSSERIADILVSYAKSKQSV